MKRWGIAGLLALLACVPVWMHRNSDPGMLADTDTVAILDGIRARSDPASWFGTDWPLGNHFYRPISTLSFEWDLSRGGEAGQFGATNALLAIAGVLLLFWFLRELTDVPAVAAGGATVFALWLVGGVGWAIQLGILLAAASAGLAILPGRRLAPALVAAGLWVFAAAELNPVAQLQARMIDWIPGRTASVMGVFVLGAMACYARFERLGAARVSPKPDPLEPPATKGTVRRDAPGRLHALWLLASVLALALALASYEQAVMLPAALLGVAASMRLRGWRVRWGWHALFWLALAGYLALRHQLLPLGVSGYQAQQFRSGPGLGLSLLDYVLPAGGVLWTSHVIFEQGVLVLLSPQLWSTVAVVGSTVAVLVALRGRWRWIVTGWALSIVAYLPMAWLKTFGHYHYWPMAMRSLLVVALIGLAAEATVSAASRPAVRAPARPSPAPGSLPRP